MKLHRTWAVIDSRTRLARSMSSRRSLASEHFRELKQTESGFRGVVRQVCVPADHRDTGSFWSKRF